MLQLLPIQFPDKANRPGNGWVGGERKEKKHVTKIVTRNTEDKINLSVCFSAQINVYIVL